MSPVIRYFIETDEKEVIDGPFKEKDVAERAARLHEKRYRYKPVVVERDLDPESFVKPKKLSERLY
jgi:hypothetical protein